MRPCLKVKEFGYSCCISVYRVCNFVDYLTASNPHSILLWGLSLFNTSHEFTVMFSKVSCRSSPDGIATMSHPCSVRCKEWRAFMSALSALRWYGNWLIFMAVLSIDIWTYCFTPFICILLQFRGQLLPPSSAVLHIFRSFVGFAMQMWCLCVCAYVAISLYLIVSVDDLLEPYDVWWV